MPNFSLFEIIFKKDLSFKTLNIGGKKKIYNHRKQNRQSKFKFKLNQGKT